MRKITLILLLQDLSTLCVVDHNADCSTPAETS